VTFLKLIANALWAGLYGSLLIVFLLFFLNDDLIAAGIGSPDFAKTLLRIGLVYTPAIAWCFPTLFICMRFFAARRLGIVWFSLKTIVWIGAATLGALTGVYYYNLRWTGALLSPGARDALRILCGAMALCWVLAVTAAALAQWRPLGRRGAHRIVAGCILLLPLALMSLMAPFMPLPAARADMIGRGPRPRPAEATAPRAPIEPDSAGRTLLLIGVEAASMDYILPLVSAVHLPTFERLLKEGASARLNSLNPCVSRVAWTMLETGMPPWSTGIKGRFLYSFGGATSDVSVLPGGLGMTALVRAGYLRPTPVREAAGRRPPFWEILRAMDVWVEVIDWPGGQPGKDHVRSDDPRVNEHLEKIIGPAPDPPMASYAPKAAILRSAIAADLSARAAARERFSLRGEAGPRLVAVRFPGLGTVSRRFLRYHLAADFGDVAPREAALFGPVLAGYYRFLDETIADLIARCAEVQGHDPDVMVVSAHGIEPELGWGILIRAFFRGGEEAASRPSGTWRGGPDGALLIHGSGVAAGAKLEEADILDVLPTALYVLGLPVSGDLRGQLLRRLFTREHLESHPVQIVPAYGARSVPRL
jgi:hypothetical protein